MTAQSPVMPTELGQVRFLYHFHMKQDWVKVECKSNVQFDCFAENIMYAPQKKESSRSYKNQATKIVLFFHLRTWIHIQVKRDFTYIH